MRIVNLTPHTVNIVTADGAPLTVAPSGQVARVSQSLRQVGQWDSIPLVQGTFGEVVGLPPQEDGVLLIVSALVRAALPARVDLASPAELVRDAEGRVIGCRALEVNGEAL